MLQLGVGFQVLTSKSK